MSIHDYKTKTGAVLGWIRELLGHILLYLLFVALFFGAAFLVTGILQLFLHWSKNTTLLFCGIATAIFAIGYGIYQFKDAITDLKITLELFDKIQEIKKTYGKNVFDSKDDDIYEPKTYQQPQQNSQSQQPSFGCPRYTEFTCGIQYRM